MIQSLRETLGTDASTVTTFDTFRRKRNVAGYDRAGLVSDGDALAMRKLAERLKEDVVRWLKKNHPQLLK